MLLVSGFGRLVPASSGKHPQQLQIPQSQLSHKLALGPFGRAMFNPALKEPEGVGLMKMCLDGTFSEYLDCAAGSNSCRSGLDHSECVLECADSA